MPHPDEGLIHAWLDGELEPAEAARVSALVANDPGWGAAAAEARGLIAASSRIAGALDRVPGKVIPRAKAAPRATRWWMMRAAALMVVVAGTVTVVRRESPELLAPAAVAPAGVAPQPVSGATSDAVASRPTAPTRAAEKKTAPAAKPRTGPSRQPAVAALSELAKDRPAAASRGALKATESPIPSPPPEAQRREANSPATGSAVARLEQTARTADVSGKAAAAPLRAAANAAPALRCFLWSQPADSTSKILKISAAALADSIRLGVWTTRGDSLLAASRRLVARSTPCP